MRLGATLPTSGPHAGADAIVSMAQQVERLGFASVWTYERLLYPLGDVPQPGGPPRPLPDHYRVTYEPIETLAYVAALTKTIRLGISVIAALFHVPVMLARRLATLDQLSRGRVIAGLGQGWIEEEFVTANVPLSRRGRGMEEFLAAMRAAWDSNPVKFEGRHYRIPPSEVNPKPVRPGGVPILIGGFAPQAIERAARLANGFNPIAFSFDSLRRAVGRFRSAARISGRSLDELEVIVRANVPITRRPISGDRPFLGGSPEQVAADLHRVADLEVDEVFFTNLAQPPIDEQVELLRSVAHWYGLGGRGLESLRAPASRGPSTGASSSAGMVGGPQLWAQALLDVHAPFGRGGIPWHPPPPA